MRALLLVDIQNDFLPGGALAVPRGDEVVEVANRVKRAFKTVVATQDWHPSDHGSFASRHPGYGVGDVVDLHGLDQILWPDHCVQGTPGASFASGLDVSRIDKIVRKGADPAVDSYSGFFDNDHRQDTGLGDYLRGIGVTDVFLMGLALDVCVQATALDAVDLGFKTWLILDGCRAMNVRPGDAERAVEAMRRAGVRIIRSVDLL